MSIRTAAVAWPVLLYTVHILPAGGLGKGGIELLDVIGAQLLYLPLSDINDFSNLRFNIFPGENEAAKLLALPPVCAR